MNLNLQMYVVQLQRGHFEVSMPWVAVLAHPVRGPSPAQLKEELMFRMLELVHGGFEPADLDQLMPPEDCQLMSVYVEVERKIDPNRPPVEMRTVTHAITGAWPGDDFLHVWLPRIPGSCFVVRRLDDVFTAVQGFVRAWAEANDVTTLDMLDCGHVSTVQSFQIELGFPAAISAQADDRPMTGRLRRPETLQMVATNLMHRVEDKTLPVGFGRQREVDELVEILSNARPANICVVGPPGVGKTALIHQAARRVHALNHSYQKRRDMWQTSGNRIIAGMSIIGQWEQRAEALCDELATRGDLLVVDDLLGLVRAGRTQAGDSNVARFIEPYLEQNQFAIVTEATEQTYELARSIAPGFVEKFRRIQLPELNYTDTLAVLSEQVRDLEGHYAVRFTPDGAEMLLHLARRFFRHDAFPGKAVQLAKQCFNEALRRLNEQMLPHIKIDADMVAEVVHRQTGLPLTILRQGHGRLPAEIRAAFESRIFGQPEAVDLMTGMVLTIEQGLSDPRRPLGCFLLIGPSGVGKTETAKALSADLFGSEDRLIRFDMSELSEGLSVTRLIGTADQPDGELTGRVRLQPFSVLLFDEIEKAHPRVLDLLLQVLGDGRLTDAAGSTVDFCNTVIMMTSNLGADSEERWMGFNERGDSDRQLHYQRSAEQFFRPEFFNRIDRVIAYQPLQPETLRRIARRTVREILERRGLRQAQVMVDVDPRLIDSLVKHSMNRRHGARTLAHRIEQELITPLAQKLTEHDAADGLTRVTMMPFADQRPGMDLRLQVIQRAPAHASATLVQPAGGPAGGPTESDDDAAVDRLVDRLKGLQATMNELTERPQTRAIFDEYETILAQLNAQSTERGWSRELSEKLRQREMFRDGVKQIQKRLDGILDPEHKGKSSAPDVASMNKARRHRLDQVALEIDHDLTWLGVQLRSLVSRSTDAATLIVDGLSGPYSQILARWCEWIKALSTRLDLNVNMAYLVAETWQRGDKTQDGDQIVQAVAFSSESPGVLALFRALEGYTWSPRLPSHGQHALLLARAVDFGTADGRILVQALNDGELSFEDEPLDYRVEFIEADGRVEDLRCASKLVIPDDKPGKVESFVYTLAMQRLAIWDDVYSPEYGEPQEV